MDGEASTNSWPSDFEAGLSELLDNVVVDENGEWKAKLSERILQLAGLRNNHPHFIVGEDSQESPDRSRSNSLRSTETQTDEMKKNVIENPKGVEETLRKLENGTLKHRMLEGYFTKSEAVSIRRKFIESQIGCPLNGIPHANYDYNLVNGACCENIIGYMPIPIGVAGPLKINGQDYYIPLVTTEGALVASTNRGCSAVMSAIKRTKELQDLGIVSTVFEDSMTRAPVISFKSAQDAIRILNWIKDPIVKRKIKEEFEKDSNYCRLEEIDPYISGSLLFLRFKAKTGDAMGMNMISKAANGAMKHILKVISNKFPDMRPKYLSLSGNMCVDKKASATNWIEGRGKSVVSGITIPEDVVQTVLKTSVDELVTLAKEKLLVGTSMSGTIGGWNAHAANIVAAMFLATGQDAAQVVSSSMCYTEMKKTETGDLYISCTMKCLEVGTVGGGTILKPQQTALEMLGCCGAAQVPGENAKRLAEIICAAVLAGELSLMASQCTDDLVRSHLKLNSIKHLEQALEQAEDARKAEAEKMALARLVGQISRETAELKATLDRATHLENDPFSSSIDIQSALDENRSFSRWVARSSVALSSAISLEICSANLARSCANIGQNSSARFEVPPPPFESVPDFRHLSTTSNLERHHLGISEKYNNVIPGSQRVGELVKGLEKVTKKVEKHKPSCANIL